MDINVIKTNKHMTRYKRYAFISYSHKDVKEAEWLHKHLEYYKLPSDIFNEYDENNRYLRPVFRDKEDIGTGVLKSVLRKELEVSEYLIIICSPNSAQSTYVSQEAQVFIDQGRIDHIIPYIIGGVPKSGGEKECFPESLINHVDQFPDDELLGANINEVGRPKAFIRVVSSLLNVEFDTLWQRHKKEQQKRLFVLSILFLFLLFFTYWFAVPLKLSVNLHDDSHHLPMPEDARLIVNGTIYPMRSLDTTICINRFPGYLRLHKVDVKFKSTYYKQIDKKVTLGYGINNVKYINLKRDSTFAIFSGKVICKEWEPVEKAKITIERHVAFTDKNGYFKIAIPVQEQTVSKKVLVEKQDFRSIVKFCEFPSGNIGYILKEK